MWNQQLVLLQLLAVTWIRYISAQVAIEFTDAEIEELVDAHNLFRGLVDPPASNMQQVVWNEELASVAQNHAEMCVFARNPNRATQAPSFATVGENLAVSISQNPNYTLFIELGWFNQMPNYDYDTNMCSSPGSCTAYTQLVWAESMMIGCGAARCPTITGLPLTDAVFLVCDYAPEANIETMRPYESGDPCSACPTNTSVCINNVCFSDITTEVPTTSTTDSTTSGTTTINAATTIATTGTTEVASTVSTTDSETPTSADTTPTASETPTATNDSPPTTRPVQQTTSTEITTAETTTVSTSTRTTKRPWPCKNRTGPQKTRRRSRTRMRKTSRSRSSTSKSSSSLKSSPRRKKKPRKRHSRHRLRHGKRFRTREYHY